MTEIISNEKLIEWYIEVTDLQNNIIGNFKSIKDAIIKLNIDKASIGNINSVIRGERRNNFIAKFSSLKMAAISTRFKNMGISRCATGKQKSYKNYIWKYENL